MKTERGNHHSNTLFLEKSDILRKDQKILEVGCGLGKLLKYLRGNGYDANGIEINEDYIRQAKSKYGLEIKRTSGEILNFEDSSFDVVLSFDVFEHIPNSDKHLEEVARVLKEKGFYLLQTPNKLINLPFEVVKGRSFTKYKRYHCSLHSYWGIKKRFSKAGFKVSFVDIPVVNEHFRDKAKKYLGWAGLLLIKIFNPDKMPIPLKSNFYIIAQKK